MRLGVFAVGKDLNVALLLDFYGEMLTEKQRDAVDLYYNEDLSLGEIAESQKITRQGVRDSIKRAETQLYEFESKLALAEKFLKYSEILENIENLAKEIYDESSTYTYSRKISDSAKKIIDCVKESREII